jgi:hypothetical protein
LRRRAILAFVATLVAGVAVVLWRGASTDVPVAFTVGPGPSPVAGELAPGAEACEQPIEMLADADRVVFWVDAGARPGVPVEAAVRELPEVGGRRLAHARLPGRDASRGPQEREIRFPRLRKGRVVALCIRNAGRHPTALAGADSAPGSGTVFAGRSGPVDLSLAFYRDRPPSVLDSVPEMFRRAALFRPGWVGTWTFWLLAVVAAVVVPLLCVVALRRA